jgi:hypothetical protein
MSSQHYPEVHVFLGGHGPDDVSNIGAIEREAQFAGENKGGRLMFVLESPHMPFYVARAITTKINNGILPSTAFTQSTADDIPTTNEVEYLTYLKLNDPYVGRLYSMIDNLYLQTGGKVTVAHEFMSGYPDQVKKASKARSTYFGEMNSASWRIQNPYGNEGFIDRAENLASAAFTLAHIGEAREKNIIDNIVLNPACVNGVSSAFLSMGATHRSLVPKLKKLGVNAQSHFDSRFDEGRNGLDPYSWMIVRYMQELQGFDTVTTLEKLKYYIGEVVYQYGIDFQENFESAQSYLSTVWAMVDKEYKSEDDIEKFVKLVEWKDKGEKVAKSLLNKYKPRKYWLF